MIIDEIIKTIKQYKKLILSIVGLVAIFLPVVLIVHNIVDITTKLKNISGVAPLNMISFTGEGKVYTTPDIAFVDFSVVTQGTDINNVQDENTKKMNKVTEFLKGFGIEEKDIKTTNYNLYPQYTYENDRVPQIIGYQINQTLSVKIRKIDQAGEILKKVVNTGINQVNSFYFGVENDEEIKEQARQIAIEDAKKKAEKLASQIGIKLGEITGFSENLGGYPVPMYESSYKATGMGGSGTPNIQAGENEIIVSVTLTYKIK